ncbi:MAG: tyrosine-type recombinase/integrase, partial [Thermoplasmata archaeon]
MKWIRIGNGHPSKQVKPESLVTIEEINQLISACENQRDKAIFSTIYDSGIRLGDLLSMKIKDITFDNYGTLLKVYSKICHPTVRVVG